MFFFSFAISVSYSLWNLLTCGCFFRVLHPATEVRNIQEENARQPKMGIHQVIAVNVLWKIKTEICSQYWLSLFLTFSLDLSIRYENWCWQKLSTSVCYMYHWTYLLSNLDDPGDAIYWISGYNGMMCLC